jgi:4-hydroxybenzoate polyprenyltransferase
LKNILDLIRWKNILLIALTQTILLWVVYPHAQGEGIMNEANMLFFLLAPMLIAAGGNVLNDIKDTAIDAINKPSKVIVGRLISEKKAYYWYFGLSLLGFLLGEGVAWQQKNSGLALIYPLTILLLWYYSTQYKRQVLVGNIVVALLCALVPFTVYILLFRFKVQIKETTTPTFFAAHWLFAYTFLAFFSTLLREIIKDIEDMEGDKRFECQTFPIFYGEKIAKNTSIFLAIFIGLSIFRFFFCQSANNPTQISFFVFLGSVLISPILYIIQRLHHAQTSSDYHHISIACKIWMLLGLLGCAALGV